MESIEYLGNVLTLVNLAAMFVGIIVGLIIGAIPGLGPPMAIALMIPISFEWPADTALILMVSTYAAGIYGGSFTAILLRAPGTSASAASAIEGYEMTKRGRATEAIRMSTFASVMGGLISGFALLYLAPPLAKISLLFRSVRVFRRRLTWPDSDCCGVIRSGPERPYSRTVWPACQHRRRGCRICIPALYLRYDRFAFRRRHSSCRDRIVCVRTGPDPL